MSYPLFIPPEPLVSIPRRSWTKRQADAYFEWLLGVQDSRIACLLDHLSFLGVPEPQDLLALGESITERLRNQIADPQTLDLTNEGLALAADLGLLTARIVLAHNPGVRWLVVRGPKTYVHYNLPVLDGFRDSLHLEPVGGSIGNARGVVKGTLRPNCWHVTYVYWSERAVPP